MPLNTNMPSIGWIDLKEEVMLTKKYKWEGKVMMSNWSNNIPLKQMNNTIDYYFVIEQRHRHLKYTNNFIETSPVEWRYIGVCPK